MGENTHTESYVMVITACCDWKARRTKLPLISQWEGHSDTSQSRDICEFIQAEEVKLWCVSNVTVHATEQSEDYLPDFDKRFLDSSLLKPNLHVLRI